MGSSEKKFCNCGHSKEAHQKKPGSKWSIPRFCHDCPCQKYLNRKFPQKSDWLFLIATVAIGIFIIGSVSIVYIEANPEILGTGETEISFTLNELYGFLALVFFAVLIFALFWFIVDPIVDFISLMRRRKFPIQGNHEPE